MPRALPTLRVRFDIRSLPPQQPAPSTQAPTATLEQVLRTLLRLERRRGGRQGTLCFLLLS